MRCKILMELLFWYSCFVSIGIIFIVHARDKENPCASNSFGARVYNFLMNSSLSGEKSKYFSTL